MMPPLPVTNAVWQSGTCASPARPMTCRGAVDHVVHTSGHARLTERQLPAGRVEREVAAIGQIVLGNPRHALAFGAEAGVFQAHQHRDRVAVVDRRDVDIGSAQPGHRERLVRGARDRSAQQIVGVGRGLERDVFAEPGDPHRAMAAATRDVGVGDQHADSPVYPHHRFQHVDRVGDHRAGQHVVDGDRGAVETPRQDARTRWCAGRRRSWRPRRGRSRTRPHNAGRSARRARSGPRCRMGSRTRLAATRSCSTMPQTNSVRRADGSRDCGTEPKIRAPRPAPRRRCRVRRRQRPATPFRRTSLRRGRLAHRNPRQAEVFAQRGRCEHRRFGDAVGEQAVDTCRDRRRRPRRPSSPTPRTGRG